MNQLIKEVGLNLKPGKYIIAVSGGIDSVVLLDLLSKKTGLKLIVAHFDHGIRSNSKQDRLFVEELSKDYKLPFHYKSVQLGKDASELVAREARYSFLFEICESEQALGVITAHHKDDVIETAIFNLIRGSGRKGISSLDSSGKLRRPLLKITKDEIMAYAKQNDIVWREDQSNKDLKYSRNLIRHKLSSQKKSKNFLNLTQHI
ncbi:MAG TPA: tRNA lysidine(34) synthetase TilS, partial [Candidatus Saccharimonadia bacterium]|nr:tRNA lysidine(34) synthetase TilS [Candidatus Saccharimonadia bacterium]